MTIAYNGGGVSMIPLWPRPLLVGTELFMIAYYV